MEYVEELLSAVREYVDDELVRYTGFLRGAFALAQPVFARSRYEEFFWHCATTVPAWLGEVVLANAKAEGEGSAKLLGLWRGVDYNQTVENQVLQHAKDESRHSRLFIELVRRAFPTLVDAASLQEFASLLPDVRKSQLEKSETRVPEDLLIDQLVQMNIGEIRTRSHMHLLAPAINAFSPKEARPSVQKILEGLVRDEVRHIGYTARLMETWAASGDSDRVAELYQRRLYDFHVITVEQTEESVRAFGQGRFPELLEI